MIPTFQRGQIGMARRPVAGGGGGGYNAEVLLWQSRAQALGATPITTDLDILQALSVALAAESYSAKIKWLAAFVGSTIAEHRVPLRDSLSAGAMTSNGSSPFTDADCDTATGIVNSTEKNAYLGTQLSAQVLNAGSPRRGGFGFWERNIGLGTNVEPMGVYDAGGARFCLDLRATFQRFRWGHVTNSQAGPATTATNGHYYGQSFSDSLREIYKDGSALGTNGTSTETTTPDTSIVFVMGCNASIDTPWKGRCAVAYMTDGTLTSGNIAALHTLLGTYLVTPTGR